MEFYEKDAKIKKFLYIIRDSPVFPIIKDSKGVVLSLPPIINGDHSKISLATKCATRTLLSEMRAACRAVCHAAVSCVSVNVVRFGRGQERLH